jgi:hypothetical protein
MPQGGRSRRVEWRTLAAPAAAESIKRDKLTFVFNFFDDLRRLVPVKN